jgi:hypothetical protein
MATNILVAVPCFGGNVEQVCVSSLLDLSERLAAAGMHREFQFMGSASAITSARNFFANRVAFDTDSAGRPFSHLLFVDADSGFEADDILTLVRAAKPIAGLPYSRKEINWAQIQRAAVSGVPAKFLREYAGTPVLYADGPLAVDGLAPVKRIGTGMMLVQADVFRALAAAHPEWRYKQDTLPGREFSFDFFQMGINPETLRYRSEDYFFCDHALELGFQTFVLSSARTAHTGSYPYLLNLRAITSLGGAPVKEAA